MLKVENIAKGVRVKLVDFFEPRSINHVYLKKEDYLIIAEQHIYNDSEGDYIRIEGASGLLVSDFLYLKELELDNQIPMEILNREISIEYNSNEIENTMDDVMDFCEKLSKNTEVDSKITFDIEIIVRRKKLNRN